MSRLAIKRLGTKFAAAAPGVNTDIFSTELQTQEINSTIRVTVALATGSVFNIVWTAGATSKTHGLNASVALNAGDLYTFSFAASRFSNGAADGTTALTFNFQVETNVAIDVLFVDEVAGGVL